MIRFTIEPGTVEVAGERRRHRDREPPGIGPGGQMTPSRPTAFATMAADDVHPEQFVVFAGVLPRRIPAWVERS
jgi:hypothetical protein